MRNRQDGVVDGNGTSGLEAVFARGSDLFRMRFALGAVAVAGVLVLVGAILAWRQYEDGKRRALSEMRTRVVLAATVFDTYFAGQLSTLGAIAGAPSVVRTDTTQMATYFSHLQVGGKRRIFTGGLAWIDRAGVSRVSDGSTPSSGVSVADRAYFRAVVSTGRPYISEGLRTRVGQRRVVIMAVPTRDARGRITGVLAGALRLRVSRTNQRAVDLGYDGLVVIDRAGQQLTLASFARPENDRLLRELRRGEGVLVDTRGLGGSSGRAVAFANARSPAWITVIDRPRTAVFASARRSLELEMASIGAAGLLALLIVGWAASRSRRDIEAEREQVRNWGELAQSLGDASAAAEVSSALGAALANAFPAARTIVGIQAEDGHAMGIWTFGSADQPPLDRRDPFLIRTARLALDANAPVHLTDSDALHVLLGVTDRALITPVGSLHAVPLATVGAATGSVTLLLPPERALDEADKALIEAHAHQAARALERARRYESEHDVAVQLQRSLLPEELPAVEGLELVGRYNAGGVGLEVGGDWYDAVYRPDGILHFTVGDVAGRGIEAAVLMGQLRNAFRALAYEHTSPAAMAQRLNRLVPETGMATAVLLTLDPFTGELRYTSAGHPPSILLDASSGTTTQLDKASAPPLGWAAPEMITETQLALTSQMTLLSYTDGLVERRGSGIDDGIARLADLLRERPELDADAISDRLLEQLVSPLAATDDIALLILRINEVPAVMKIEIPSDPSLLRGLRARLSVWLERRGLDEKQRADTILAVSEACNNAMEHAYRQRMGTIRLTLEHEDGALRIAVEDDGAWQAPIPDSTRGRGILIMERTVDTVRVSPGAAGTRVELQLRLSGDREA